MKIEAGAGEHISSTAAEMVKTARESGETVTCEFNEILLTAKPNETTAEEIVAAYNKESDRRHQEWISSPEYKEQQRQMREKDKQDRAFLRGALAAAPKKMTLSDEAGWAKTVKVNSDGGYGQAVIEFADQWARLMEARMATGQTLAECAEETSHAVSAVAGITGFQYGCAVGILSKVWVHGEQLRRWHNLKTQLGDEGERANREGGVLNPALLNLG